MSLYWSLTDARLHLHPQADVVPSMTPDEYDALAADIAERGITVPLDVTRDGTILDGRHRFAIAVALGLADVPFRLVETDDPVGYMVRAALLRRHLTIAQRRHLAAGLLTQQPERSDRQVAAAVGLSDKTVSAVRDELEGRADIPHVEARTDTLGRQQPVARDLPITDVHRRKFPDLAAAELRAELTSAMYAMGKTDRFDPAVWGPRLADLRDDDVALIRSHVKHLHRWVEEWESLLAPQPLRIVGGVKP